MAIDTIIYTTSDLRRIIKKTCNKKKLSVTKWDANTKKWHEENPDFKNAENSSKNWCNILDNNKANVDGVARNSGTNDYDLGLAQVEDCMSVRANRNYCKKEKKLKYWRCKDKMIKKILQ